MKFAFFATLLLPFGWGYSGAAGCTLNSTSCVPEMMSLDDLEMDALDFPVFEGDGTTGEGELVFQGEELVDEGGETTDGDGRRLVEMSAPAENRLRGGGRNLKVVAGLAAFGKVADTAIEIGNFFVKKFGKPPKRSENVVALFQEKTLSKMLDAVLHCTQGKSGRYLPHCLKAGTCFSDGVQITAYHFRSDTLKCTWDAREKAEWKAQPRVRTHK